MRNTYNDDDIIKTSDQILYVNMVSKVSILLSKYLFYKLIKLTNSLTKTILTITYYQSIWLSSLCKTYFFWVIFLHTQACASLNTILSWFEMLEILLLLFRD